MSRPASAGPSAADGSPAARPIGSWALLGAAVASLGGPLALAAQGVPGVLADASGSAGLVSIAAATVFCVPLLIWLRYSGRVSGAGGLYGFVETAVGRPLALVQAGLWTASYLLYLVYTAPQIVYGILPDVLPGVGPYRPILELALPTAIALVMLAGRTPTLAVLGALAVAQLLLVGALAAVAIGHDAPPASFAPHPPLTALGTATAQTALLYVCGGLPLFLGGEIARPTRTMRRALLTGYALVAVGVTAAVFPLAANPAFTRAPIPGMALAQVFAGPTLATAVGLGVAASAVGLILMEFLALTRLLHAITRRSTRTLTRALAAVLVGTAPLTLIDPDAVYTNLLKPSLIALWLSQLVVFAGYPRFTARDRRPHLISAVLDLTVAATASALACYGVYSAIAYPTGY
jgi:hypothetical protein